MTTLLSEHVRVSVCRMNTSSALHHGNPAEVPDTAYYRRMIACGDLIKTARPRL
ncbi:hypothetical protein [Morganella morganii]|uniref:hypothetical protein n=1 Tax=Morganella morganii TaxID=582 RepID=UPI00187CD21C|nr:hypothetical protein [Morganella morganii]